MKLKNKISSKRGRPSKEGDRYPSGKLKTSGGDGSFPPAAVKRMLEAAKSGVMRQEFGTVLGYLHLTGKLRVEEMTAGLTYARLAEQYRCAKGLPTRSTKPAFNPDERGKSLRDETPEHDAKIIDRFEKMFRLMMPAQKKLVDMVCIDNTHPDWAALPTLKSALEILISAFDLTKHKK